MWVRISEWGKYCVVEYFKDLLGLPFGEKHFDKIFRENFGESATRRIQSSKFALLDGGSVRELRSVFGRPRGIGNSLKRILRKLN